MKNLIVKVGLVSMFLISLNCSRNEVVVEPEHFGKNSIENFQSKPECEITVNQDNPYNFVGQIHNEILYDYLVENDDNVENVDSLIFKVEKIAFDNSNFQNYNNSNYTSPNSAALTYGASDFVNGYSNVIGNMAISSAAKTKISELVDYFFDKVNNNTEPSYTDVNLFLNNFENSIIVGPNSFTTEEKKVLFSAVATAKYSNCFWYNYLNIASQNEAKGEGGRKWFHWLIIGVSDALGGAVAAIPAAGAPPVGGAIIVSGAVAASGLAYTMTSPKNK